MKNILLTLFGLALGVNVQAQLVNNGGSITVENGAVLFVESDIQNTLSGTITNNGTIEVQGDFDNSLGTLTSGAGSIVEFSGSAAADFTPGTHTVSNVVMSKAAADVTLLGDLQVDENVSFEAASKLNTSSHSLTLDQDATITTPAADRYVIADAGVGGSVVKLKDNADDFTFPIGDATYYTPVEVSGIAGTTGASSSISASTEAIKSPNAPAEATDFINRYWDVAATGITGFEATLTGTYNDADVDGAATEASISGAGYDGSEWDYTGSLGDAAANEVTVEVDYDDVEFTGTNKFGKVDITAYLQGAYSGGTMTTSLGSVLPLTSPYDPAVTVTSIPANVTDWIEIEVRDATSPSTVLSTQSAFIRNDGKLLDLQGNVSPLLKDAPTTGYIGINHRNHLSVNTPVALDLSFGNFDSHDFSTGLSQAYDDSSVLNNDAMVDLGSGVYGMFRGDANGNNTINVLDAAIVRNASVPIQNGIYLGADVNMNGTVNVVDAGITKAASVPIKSAHTH